MITVQYRLVRPFVMETAYKDISLCETGKVIVRPEYLAVCKADMRYFFGMRDAGVMKKRLPMSLIHEACGEVLLDPAGRFRQGQKVVLLPNIPGEDEYYAENYRLDSLFRSSRADGFMQEMMALAPQFLVPYPERLPGEIMAFTEFISVGIHAVRSFAGAAGVRKRHVAVWGDGALSYIVCSVLKCLLPDTKVTVIGINPVKLQYFTFVDEEMTVNQVDGMPRYDHAFECVGGSGSGNAINQMISTVLPEGMMVLLGVSEELVPVNTRMVLEKGLTIMGRSRSERPDFEKAVELLEGDAVFAGRMRHMISAVVEAANVDDISRAFDLAKTADFKVVIKWNV